MTTGRQATSMPNREMYDLPGKDVYDLDGQKVGTAATLYVPDGSGSETPEWVTVKTGLFGTKESFVPLTGARTDAAGLHVRARKDTIKAAPRADKDAGLSEREVPDLYRHYGLAPGAAGRAGGGAADTGAQHSVTRSEERLRAGTETVESGRVRLRKYVVTEEQQVTVPVRHEEVQVVREPAVPEQARGTAGPARIEDDEREVVLHEERPVLDKETVPVEKVGLRTRTVEEQRKVSGTVRKERVEVDDPDQRR